MAAGVTYTPIATTTLGSAQASVTFGSGGTLSQAYTDLVLVCNFQLNTGSVNNLYLRFNGNTGSNYSDTLMYGQGSGYGGSGGHQNFSAMLIGDASTNWCTAIMNINNYSNSTTYKTVLCRYNDTTDAVMANIGLWRSTSAINTILIYPGSNSFNTGSIFTLYGITAA